MPSTSDAGKKQIIVGVCAMSKKSAAKPMRNILSRLEDFHEGLKVEIFSETMILNEEVDKWPRCDCLVSFHSKGFPLDKAIAYAKLRKPFVINDLETQYALMDRVKVYEVMRRVGVEVPRFSVLIRDKAEDGNNNIVRSGYSLVESDDCIEVNGVIFNKPFVEKPVSAENHNINIYFPSSAGGGSQRLFRKVKNRSSVYDQEKSSIQPTGSFIYEDFMPTDGTDVKVYAVGPYYAHAEARKSPGLDGKVERDQNGKEIRYPVILTNAEKMIARKLVLAFKQTVCGFDLLRSNGKSYVCDVNGFSFVKSSVKYYEDTAKILGNMIFTRLAKNMSISWSPSFQLDDPPLVSTTYGKMMELRTVLAVIRHGDRTPKQKMKMEVKHPRWFGLFRKYNGYRNNELKLKQPHQLQEVLDIARDIIKEEEFNSWDLHDKSKMTQMRMVLEMYGYFSGINRKVQLKYQPSGRPRRTSETDKEDATREPSLLVILKWGGELTTAGRIQAEELGKAFRCLYPGGQGQYGGDSRGLGFLRLHSTYRHDLKIYASDEGRVQMTAAAFAKGLLALEGELTPILVQMVKSANTNGLLDDDYDARKCQGTVKKFLHNYIEEHEQFIPEDMGRLNPLNSLSIRNALEFISRPREVCEKIYILIGRLLMTIHTVKSKKLYLNETLELAEKRWAKLHKDFRRVCKNQQIHYDISKIPDIYDCVKYDIQHNSKTMYFDHIEELYICSKYLSDIVVPQEYGIARQEKLMIGQGICTPLMKKIRTDLQRCIENEHEEENMTRLDPRASQGIATPLRHVRTRLYFTSESHIHSLMNLLRYGDLIKNIPDSQWERAMTFLSSVTEFNYMAQLVLMLYEDTTKAEDSDKRFHIEIHFSPGALPCIQTTHVPGLGYRPKSRESEVVGVDIGSSDLESSLARLDEESHGKEDMGSPQKEEDVIREPSFTEISVAVNQELTIATEPPSAETIEVTSVHVSERKASESASEKLANPSPHPSTNPLPILKRQDSATTNMPQSPKDQPAITIAPATTTGVVTTDFPPVSLASGPLSCPTPGCTSRAVTTTADADEALGPLNRTLGQTGVVKSFSDIYCHVESLNRLPFSPATSVAEEIEKQNHYNKAVAPFESTCNRVRMSSYATVKHHTFDYMRYSELGNFNNNLISTAVISGHHPDPGKNPSSAESVESLLMSTAVMARGVSAPELVLNEDMADPSLLHPGGITSSSSPHNAGSESDITLFVPPLRSLETLHNQLSHKDVDEFLERIITLRTPIPSPPKTPRSSNSLSRENSIQCGRLDLGSSPTDTKLSAIRNKLDAERRHRRDDHHHHHHRHHHHHHHNRQPDHQNLTIKIGHQSTVDSSVPESPLPPHKAPMTSVAAGPSQMHQISPDSTATPEASKSDSSISPGVIISRLTDLDPSDDS